MKRIAGGIILMLAIGISGSCNRDISRTERGVEAPAGRDAQGQTDPTSVTLPEQSDTGAWTGTTPETAPGGY